MKSSLTKLINSASSVCSSLASLCSEYPELTPLADRSAKHLQECINLLSGKKKKREVVLARNPPPPITFPDIKVDPEAEVGGCKALMLEIIRRAAYDWVLYRTSRIMNKRKLAEEAYIWLFIEEPGHAHWAERCKNGKKVTAFVEICEAVGLPPDIVRSHIKRLTVKNVMSIGRPAEYRRHDWRHSSDSYSAPGLDSGDESYDDLLPFDGLADDL